MAAVQQGLALTALLHAQAERVDVLPGLDVAKHVLANMVRVLIHHEIVAASPTPVHG